MRIERRAAVNGNGHNPRLDGWFKPEPLDPRVLRRALTLRAWRERNALIGALIESTWRVESVDAA